MVGCDSVVERFFLFQGLSWSTVWGDSVFSIVRVATVQLGMSPREWKKKKGIKKKKRKCAKKKENEQKKFKLIIDLLLFFTQKKPAWK